MVPVTEISVFTDVKKNHEREVETYRDGPHS